MKTSWESCLPYLSLKDSLDIVVLRIRPETSGVGGT